MSNALEVVRGRSVVRVAAVVNSTLFTLMREVFKIDPSAECSLSLDQVGDHYVFSLYASAVGDRGEHLYDLWSYTPKTLPAWLLDRNFHL